MEDHESPQPADCSHECEEDDDLDDYADAEIATQRLAEIAANPECLVRGEALADRMKEWLSETPDATAPPR